MDFDGSRRAGDHFRTRFSALPRNTCWLFQRHHGCWLQLVDVCGNAPHLVVCKTAVLTFDTTPPKDLKLVARRYSRLVTMGQPPVTTRVVPLLIDCFRSVGDPRLDGERTVAVGGKWIGTRFAKLGRCSNKLRVSRFWLRIRLGGHLLTPAPRSLPRRRGHRQIRIY